jgi:hypothetical protein
MKCNLRKEKKEKERSQFCFRFLRLLSNQDLRKGKDEKWRTRGKRQLQVGKGKEERKKEKAKSFTLGCDLATKPTWFKRIPLSGPKREEFPSALPL